MRNPDDILASEVDWFYFGSGTTLVGGLNFSWEKRRTADGAPPYDLEAPDEPEYYICRSRNLLLCEDHEFYVEALNLLYGVEHLTHCGEGPQAVPDSYTEDPLGYYKVDLTNDVEELVIDVLIEDIEFRNESLLKHIAFKNDPESYVRAIKDKRLVSRLLPYWEANKEDWI